MSIQSYIAGKFLHLELMHKYNYLLFILLITTLLITGCNTTRNSNQEVLQPLISTPYTTEIAILSTETQPKTNQMPSGTPSQQASPQPRQTPNLADIVLFYLKNKDLFRWRPNTSPQKVTSIGSIIDFQFSESQQKVALERLVSEKYIEIWIKDLSSGEEFLLLGIQDLADLAYDEKKPNAISFIPNTIQWIPNSNKIAFNIRQILDGPGSYLLDDLRWADVNNRTYGTLLLPGYGGEFAYAPNGSKIALTTPTQVNLVNADGTEWKNLLQYDQINTYSDYPYYPMPIWHHDSNQFMLSIPPKDPLNPELLPTNLWNFDISKPLPQLIRSFYAVPFFINEISLSPDLKQIAYLHQTGAPAENLCELHIAEIYNDDDIIYNTNTLLQFTGWGKDSLHFTYRTNTTDETWLGKINNQPSLIASDATGISNIYWLDGSRFVFLKEEKNTFNLYVANITGDQTKIDEYLTPPLIAFSKAKKP